MIGWLSGVVVVREPMSTEVVIDCGGVGYQVMVSWQTMADVPEVGQPCQLWIHTHVREDALVLFGFATPHERQAFRLLMSVPQVGPKLAIGVLGGFPLGELLAAIAEGERRTLERIPGVGKRTAERILLDLKEKVEPLRDALAGTSAAKRPAASGDSAIDPRLEEARAVLINLGWKAKPVELALEKVLAEDEELDLDGFVRRGLAVLMAR